MAASSDPGAGEPGNGRSPWSHDVDLKEHPPLRGDVVVDVCVIGGGIAGLMTAYLLSQTDRSVLVLEDGRIGGGETGRTTAHLASAIDERFTYLERVHGAEGARLALRSHAAAIDLIESIVRRHGIACDFERVEGWLFTPEGRPDLEFLKEEIRASRQAGFRKARLEPRAPLPDFDTGPAIAFPDQAQFHPMKFLDRLAELIEERHGRICEGTHVEEVVDGTPVVVRTSDGRVVRASKVVVATNAPITSRVQMPLKQFAHRTYAIALAIPRGAIPRALYWDTDQPYHYVRLQPGPDPFAGDLLIVGGEDHRTGQDEVGGDERFRRLEEWTRRRVPAAGEVRHRWSGQILEPADGLAFIGRDPGAGENLLIATGDSGNGMTHGTIAGLLLRDLVLERPNPWETLYSPRRVTMRTIAEVAREQMNVLPRYGSWLTPGDVTTPSSIPRGEGRIVRSGLKKLACYRDEEGGLHTMSAVCPHLGGVVTWNRTERSWDCPCHGSRFGPTGRVVNGPANSNLSPAELEAPRRRARKGKPAKRPPAPKGRPIR